MPDGARGQRGREDPAAKGLLFAGTEQQVYVSFDDGDHWQSLRLNMPATSIRDLVDQGRRPGRRRRTAAASGSSTTSRRCGSSRVAALPTSHLFTPAACAARALEHEHGHAAAAGGAGRPESAGRRDRRLLPGVGGGRAGDAGDPRRGRDGRAQVLERRTRPSRCATSRTCRRTGSGRPLRLSTARRHAPLRVGSALHARRTGMRRSFPIAAVFHDTPREPNGSWAMPGHVHGEADGERHERDTQPLTLGMDPRVKTPVVGAAAASSRCRSSCPMRSMT